MDAEHKRPLAAFVVVTVASALLLGQSLNAQSSSDDPTTAAQVSGRSTGSTAPSGSPANGQAVDGITSTPPTAPTVKSIGRAPMLFARGDDGLGISVGAVTDPDTKQTDPVRTRDDDDATPDPQGQPGPPESKPSGGPIKEGEDDDGSPGNSGDHSQGPGGGHGPHNGGVHPTPPSHGPQ